MGFRHSTTDTAIHEAVTSKSFWHNLGYSPSKNILIYSPMPAVFDDHTIAINGTN